MERPTAVTILGWFLRVGGVLGMALALPYARWGEDLFGQYWVETLRRLGPTVIFLWVFLSSLLCLVLGNGLLKGRNWARVLVVVYSVAATLIGGVLYRDLSIGWLNLIANLAFTAVVGFFLYRPAATAFFTGQSPLDGLDAV